MIIYNDWVTFYRFIMWTLIVISIIKLHTHTHIHTICIQYRFGQKKNGTIFEVLFVWFFRTFHLKFDNANFPNHTKGFQYIFFYIYKCPSLIFTLHTHSKPINFNLFCDCHRFFFHYPNEQFSWQKRKEIIE